MSAAAVISLRIKRTLRLLKDRGAVSPETAIGKQEVPYADRWYIRRLVSYGAIGEIGDRWYLNEARAAEYIAARRQKALFFLVIVLLLTLVYCTIFVR